MPRRSVLNYVGIAILIIGMACGELLYWHGLHEAPASGFDGESPYDSRVYEQTMERTVGVFGVIMDEILRALAKLKEPCPLGVTIALCSIAAAGGCFLVASRLPPD